jgi:ATP-dependent RNA helicase SUPV3L1/SUV3
VVAAEPKPRREGGDRGGYKGNKPREGGEGRGDRSQGDRPQGEARSDNRKPYPKAGGRDGGKYEGGKPEAKPQRSFEARPPRVEKPVDPDNPFAVLAALKLNK